MNDKKQLFLDLIEELDLPFTQEDAKEHLDNLSEEELDVLIRKFQSVENYQGALDDFLQEADPAGFQKIQEEYLTAKSEVEEKSLKDMEKIQEETDTKSDEAEKNVVEQTEKIVKDEELELSEISEFQNDLTQSMDIKINSEKTPDI